MNNKAFIFVVCGERKHIETLNFSLKYLKKFSNYPIWVITDLKRNEIEINHDNIINISTPFELNNHQASIYLKTQLPFLLPDDVIYCYLDSDVIAVSREINNIFSHFVPPVTFASDNKEVDLFSPYSVNCGCLEKHLSDHQEFWNIVSHIVPNFDKDIVIKMPETRDLLNAINNINKKPFLNIIPLIKYVLYYLFGNKLINKIKIKDNLYLDTSLKNWVLNEKIFYPNLTAYRKEIYLKSNKIFKWKRQSWINKEGKDIFKCKCSHLREEIRKTFSLHIPKNYIIWNGGVFIFNNQAKIFFKHWHENTMNIFKNSYWKIRDQATLLVTAFQLNLQKHYNLPETYNFLADFYDYSFTLSKNDYDITIIKDNKKIKPYFLHIYHEFGNNNWDLWQKILSL